jgi:acyl carrier protein
MSINGLEIVCAAIDEVNELDEDGPVIGKAEDTALFGADTGVDSLMLVNLFTAIEQQIEDATGQIVVIIDEDALADESHPFQTVGSLAQYIENIVN